MTKELFRFIEKRGREREKGRHSRCAIYRQIGRCIMPKEGIFARVIHSGFVEVGDEIEIVMV